MTGFGKWLYGAFYVVIGGLATAGVISVVTPAALAAVVVIWIWIIVLCLWLFATEQL
jgi:hypothetical protein